MKNKRLIRVLIASLFAFMLYSFNLRQVKKAKLEVIEPRSTRVAKNQKKEPKLKTKKLPNKSEGIDKDVAIEKGSQKQLASKIAKNMKASSYQVAVQDLNNSSRYARLATASEAKYASGVLRILILATIYKQEQRGKIHPRANIKIKKADRVKGEKLLQKNMQYGIAYLRQAMMHGNKTAANALLRKAGRSNVNKVAKEFGTSQTEITGNFSQKVVGKTTAKDLDLILKGIYQGRVLNRQHAQIVLMAMHGSHTKLTSQISGTIYSVGDSHFTAAIVQSNGHSYCISSWTDSQKNLAGLGKAVNTWFEHSR